MGSDGLFHIDGGNTLVAMTITPYAAEDLLQGLLESHPDLLAGGQMTPHAPRRWALIRREQSVPDGHESAGRWSIDHLFVDQDAVPTLVEVKRSSDTRIRREVVGQMLDYAANGVRYWPLDNLRAAFESTQHQRGRDPLDVVRELCDDPARTVEDFFTRVGDNLRSGRIRMVFVADIIPDELQRIVEFLNEQMSPGEVYAVEVKQYRAAGYPGSVIVPAVFGRTAAAINKSPAGPTVSRADVMARSKPSTLRAHELVLELASSRGFRTKETASGLLLQTLDGRSIANIWLAAYDSIDVPLKPLRERGLATEADDLLSQLQAMTTKALTSKSPTIPTEDVVANWAAFVSIFDQIAGLYRRVGK